MTVAIMRVHHCHMSFLPGCGVLHGCSGYGVKLLNKLRLQNDLECKQQNEY